MYSAYSRAMQTTDVCHTDSLRIMHSAQAIKELVFSASLVSDNDIAG